MQALHIQNENPIKICQKTENSYDAVNHAVAKLTDYLHSMMHNKDAKSFSEHEVILTQHVLDFGRHVMAKALSHYDVQSDMIGVGEQSYRKKHCSPKTYQTMFGPIDLERHVYVNRKKDGDGKSLCPLELQAGMIESYWTPNSAKNAAWALGHLTPQETEDLFLQLGGMNPSKSSLDRLPKALNAHWEPQTIQNHQELINSEIIPENAVTMATSLDGVMVAMKPDKTTRNKWGNGHCDWREASCGTISFYDKDGERISTTQYSRMPESKKETLKSLLKQHVDSATASRPDLNIVYVADGARDNWTFIEEEMPLGFEVADFYHVCEYLKSGFEAALDEDLAKEAFDKYKRILRDEDEGIKKVLRTFRYHRDKNKNSEAIQKTLTYLTNNQHRMKYSEAQRLNYPIGSGVVEATCKTLVGQRLKRSGMSWELPGGQAILTLRSLIKSHRFEKAWEKMADVYKKTVNVYSNIVSLPERNLN